MEMWVISEKFGMWTVRSYNVPNKVWGECYVFPTLQEAQAKIPAEFVRVPCGRPRDEAIEIWM